MSPQNTAIVPSVDNDFTLIIDGSSCIAYRLSVYDFNNNKITPPSTDRVDLGSTLYDDDTLTITVSSGTLTAGNNYKWQIELYANDLTVSNVDTGTDVLTSNNHNLNTGDIIYIQATTTIPAGLSAFTKYYVRKLTANTFTLYTTYEGAKSGGTAIDITSAGAGTITISNIAISEQIPFYVYSAPTLVLSTASITEQSFEFVPVYTQAENIIVNKFNAYLYDSNDVLLEETDDIYSANVRYTFDGLLSGSTYKVKFIATNAAGQECTTGLVSFSVSYVSLALTLRPEVTNKPNTSSILMEWSGIYQLTGVVTGASSYTSDFIETGNTALQLDAGTILEFSDVNITTLSTETFLWYPSSISFTGNIKKWENTDTGDYLIIGYNGDRFYVNINGTLFYNPLYDLVVSIVYLLAIKENSLIVVEFATI